MRSRSQNHTKLPSQFYDTMRTVPALTLLSISCRLAETQGQATAVTTLVTNLNDCVPENEFEAGVDYFPEKFTPVLYSPNFASDVFIPDVTTDLLYQCGTKPPADEIAKGKHHLVLPIPHKGGIAVTETPQVVPLEMLGKRSEIIAYMTDPTWLASPCVNTLIDDGQVEVIYDYATQDKLNADFLKRHPDAIIYGGQFGDPEANNTIIVSYTKERTNVATFDWLALHAALFNLERESNRIAAETKDRYDCSANNARQLSAERTDRPVVLWATYFDYENLGWSIGECPTWNHTWYCELAEHCGATILQRPEGVGTDKDGYWYLDDQQLLELGKDADIFFYPINTWDTTYNRSKDVLDQFKSVQNAQVYDILGVGSWAWSERRAYEYDVVALDFCEVVGNGNDRSQFAHKVKWFRNAIENTTSVELEACPLVNVYQTYVPEASSCEPLPAAGTASGAATMTNRSPLIVSTAAYFLGVAMVMILA
jgi:hypothetical protein